MTRVRTVLGGLAVLGAAAALSACVSVFPKQPPAQLYRFGTVVPEQTAPAGPRFNVLNSVITFDHAASTDRILTVSGNEAAYIKASRWVAPAPGLFDEAVGRAFANGGSARLMSRGEVVHAEYVLKIDVRSFEARYEHGSTAAPTVVVTVHAALDRTGDRGLMGDRTFEARVEASDNRVSAIATAFDQATAKVLGDLVGWVDSKGQG